MRKALQKIKMPKKLDVVLIVVAVFFLWFNCELLEIYREVGSIPEAYACAIVAALLGEAGICGWIKTQGDKIQERKWSKEDQKKKPDVDMSNWNEETKKLYFDILADLEANGGDGNG